MFRVAHVGDVFAKAHGANGVGAAADRYVHHHLVEAFALAGFGVHRVAPSAAEDGQTTHGQRQLAVGLFEAETHGALAQHVQARHIGQHGLVGRRGVRPHQRVKAVAHVFGQHRLPVVKARLGVDHKGHRQAVGRGLHIAGQEAIGRATFIQRTGQQALEHQVGEVSRCAAAHREGVVFVKGRHAQIAHQAQLAAFGRLRVDVVEVREVGRVLQLAPQSVAVRGPSRGTQPGAGQQGQHRLE